MRTGKARLIWIGFNHFKPKWTIRPHAHSFHEIVLLVQGSMRLIIGGQEHAAEPGDVLFYPEGQLHNEWSVGEKPLESYFMNFRWPKYPGNPPVRLRDEHGRLRMLMDWLLAERVSPTRLAPMLNDAILQNFLAQYVRLWTCREDDFVEAVRRFVRQHITESISLENLSGEFHLSKHHFARRFKRLAGRTPMDDARLIRVETALELLLSTDLPLKDIAARTGLADQYHLSHLFRRYVGATPGSFRPSRR